MQWHRANRDRTNAASRKSKLKHKAENQIADKARRIERAKIAGSGPLPADKCCTKCGEMKALAKFRKSKATLDGRTAQCCTCAAARTLEWRNTRREKNRELDRARYKADPERHRARTKAYNARNREKVRVENRKRYKRDAAKIGAHLKARYDANAEEMRARSLAWAKAHRKECNDRYRKRKLKKRALPGSHTLAEWNALCERYDKRCVCCGEKRPLTRDHIIPITKPGASDSIENIQPMCAPCNASKRQRSIDYRAAPFTGKNQQVSTKDKISQLPGRR